MATVGITALIPPEITYGTGNTPLDINNLVPRSKVVPRDKLCAWTAVWRELALKGRIKLDRLVVVAGGDCNNALVDGERLEGAGTPTHYFTYPFDGSRARMKEEIQRLIEFLGGSCDRGLFREVGRIKRLARRIDMWRVRGEVDPEKAFAIEVAGSDLGGDLEGFRKRLEGLEREKVDYDYPVALIGTPPIYPDFHRFLSSIGLHVVYDEMPYEFIRLGGSSITGLAESYGGYTFSRHITTRLEAIERELRKRKAEAVIHNYQFACHHKLEDRILRDRLNRELGYPYISIEGDLPSRTPEQTKLRLEAFKERLGGYL
ncbi:MAG: 2-hydroxyacyl-CoA dehydratase [Methanobacteriota archaeon]|nr:MAG: 2-hydroxyacyl-CoA dehydratase [Euryarchaeota archaeon]